MANRARKNISSNQDDRQGLRLIQGGKRQSKDTSRLLWGFVLLFTSGLLGLFLYSLHNKDTVQLTDKRFYGLHEVYKQEGILKFQEEKGKLKTQVTETLKNSTNEEEQQFATNVAVYLFPEVLPDTNFEKTVALEQWGAFTEAIEKKPRTPESRVWFEEVRANIWNYESPDRHNPKLSPFAKETLRIYDEISSP